MPIRKSHNLLVHTLKLCNRSQSKVNAFVSTPNFNRKCQHYFCRFDFLYELPLPFPVFKHINSIKEFVRKRISINLIPSNHICSSASAGIMKLFVSCPNIEDDEPNIKIVNFFFQQIIFYYSILGCLYVRRVGN